MASLGMHRDEHFLHCMVTRGCKDQKKACTTYTGRPPVSVLAWTGQEFRGAFAVLTVDAWSQECISLLEEQAGSTLIQQSGKCFCFISEVGIQNLSLIPS